MLQFLQRILGRNPSKKVAKERLRLVLMHDRASLSPEVLDALKSEIIEVISHYLEIDETNLDVSLESDNESVALVANIPILKAKQIG